MVGYCDLQVHVSFVRSVQMDSWTDKEIKAMKEGGNQALLDFFDKYNIPRDVPIEKKYNSAAAELYREMYQFSRYFMQNQSKSRRKRTSNGTASPIGRLFAF